MASSSSKQSPASGPVAKNGQLLHESNVWSSGPDSLFPATSYTATSLAEGVKLRLGDEDALRYPPLSIYTMMKQTVEKKPNHYALAFKPDIKKPWVKFTYNEYWTICHKVARNFIRLGLGTNEVVTILGFNSPHWFFANLGAIFAGGVGCGIYTTNTAEACQHILDDCKSQIVVVENKVQLAKILKLKDVVSLRAIIQYSNEPIENTYNGLVMSWSTFMSLSDGAPGSASNDLALTDLTMKTRIKSIAPNRCAVLIYTSGTTGNPKAVMLSHDNITYIVRHAACDLARLRPFKEVFVSYLPLSHIAGQVIDIYTPLRIGGTVYFAQPDALKGSLVDTLKEARPTYFFGVPRVWEKMSEKIQQTTKELTGIKASLFKWAQEVSTQRTMNLFAGNTKMDASYKAAKVIIINKILTGLGLDRCQLMFSGAAPITKETLDFFYSIGIPLVETYGMSETTGPHSVGNVTVNSPMSCGTVVNTTNLSRLRNGDEDGSGELCVNGRHVFMGYLNNRRATAESFDQENWLMSGDIAKIEQGKYLFITGRLKELIITAGGENVAPVPIEDNIKAALPDAISNVMLVGDKRKYLVVICTLKTKVNLDTMVPQDELTEPCLRWVQSLGSKARTVTEIINSKDPLVYKAIDEGIRKANEKSQSRAAKVQKFALLARDFSIPTGELGPTLKLRRPVVSKMYAKQIDGLYADGGAAE
jgi:long-chain-fatty-acid--CoA ligase ACSBG